MYGSLYQSRSMPQQRQSSHLFLRHLTSCEILHGTTGRQRRGLCGLRPLSFSNGKPLINDWSGCQHQIHKTRTSRISAYRFLYYPFYRSQNWKLSAIFSVLPHDVRNTNLSGRNFTESSECQSFPGRIPFISPKHFHDGKRPGRFSVTFPG